MKPIGKYIIVETIEETLKTESGLLLSQEDASNFRYKKGKVVKAGTDVGVIADGDVIYYDKSSGHTLFVNEKPFTVIIERDVVVVV